MVIPTDLSATTCIPNLRWHFSSPHQFHGSMSSCFYTPFFLHLWGGHILTGYKIT